MIRQNLSSLIKVDHIILKDYAKEIIDGNIEVVLYGAGCWAKQQYRMLQECGVQIKAVGIDSRYCQPGMRFFDFDILPIENLMDEFPDAALWVGFNLDKESYNELQNRLQGRFGKRKIFACDCAKYENFANQNYKYSDVISNEENFQWLYDKLVDEKSRETFLSYLSQRISGDYSYAENVYDSDHYFAKDLVQLENEVFVDCGAFTGDTIQDLFSKVEPLKVYAFEPDENNYRILKDNFEGKQVLCLQKGAFSKKTTLFFVGGNADASKIADDGDIQIEVDTIDNILQGQQATFIKMDIEGSELEALKGAEKTIRQFHPKLAISAYHKFEDLFTLPQYIYSLNNEYKFYVRRHSHLTHELVLYAL